VLSITTSVTRSSLSQFRSRFKPGTVVSKRRVSPSWVARSKRTQMPNLDVQTLVCATGLLEMHTLIWQRGGSERRCRRPSTTRRKLDRRLWIGQNRPVVHKRGRAERVPMHRAAKFRATPRWSKHFRNSAAASLLSRQVPCFLPSPVPVGGDRRYCS
jgi:hypothetical protein